MESLPTVSIVLPVYNGEKYLSCSIESVVAQTFSSWELIIVDDCSTDSTPLIAKKWEASDERIHYTRNETNKKLPASLNVGFSLAQGKYLTWTSDDNLFREDALALMVGALDANPEADLVYCRMQRIDGEGKPIPPLHLPQSRIFIYCVNVVLACFLYRRELQEKLRGYDEGLFLVEDYDFWLRANRESHLLHLKEAPYFYRVHGGALTKTRALEIRNRACSIVKREMKNPDLALGRRALAAVGLAVNTARRQLLRARAQ